MPKEKKSIILRENSDTDTASESELELDHPPELPEPLTHSLVRPHAQTAHTWGHQR